MLMGGFFVCSGMQAERTAKKFSDIVQEAPRMICLWAPHAAVLRNFFQSTLGCPRSGCVEHRHILAPVFCLLLWPSQSRLVPPTSPAMADSSWEHVEQLQAEIAALEAVVRAAGGSLI